MNPSSNKTIYLHAGTHKTGSSAIQWTIRGAQQQLIDLGFDCIRQPNEILDPVLSVDPVSTNTLDIARSQFDEAVSHAKADNLIVSYELIFGDPETGYPNNSANLEHMKYIIGERPCNVLIFLRRQDLFVESHYVQMVKTNYTGSFEDYANSLSPDCFNWNTMIGSYEKVFGRDHLTVLPYEGDVVDHFFTYLGIPRPDWKADKDWQMNPSVSLYGMELKRRCNRHLVTHEEKVRLKYLMVEFFPKQAGEPFDFFSGAERLKFLDPYLEGNRELESRYSTRFFPDISAINPEDKSSLHALPEVSEGTVNLICDLVRQLVELEKG